MYLLPYVTVAALLQSAIFWGAASGRPWIALVAALIASPLSLLATSIVQGRALSDIFNAQHQSWNAMFGDGLVLAPAIYVAARYVTLQGPGAVAWCVTASLIGFTGGILFHVWDAANYRRGGYGYLADVISKLTHDVVSWSVLMAAFVGLGGLLIAQHAKSLAMLSVVVAVLVWMGLAVVDTYRATSGSSFAQKFRINAQTMHGNPVR